MSNFTLNPRSGADRARIVDWANRHHVPVQTAQNESGHIVFGFGKDDLKATSAYSDLKRIAQFDNVSGS